MASSVLNTGLEHLHKIIPKEFSTSLSNNLKIHNVDSIFSKDKDTKGSFQVKKS